MFNMSGVDAIVNSGRWAPRWGWHDDHRHNDRRPEYLPAMQQVRAEFADLAEVLRERGLLGGRCLQLGIGEVDCSHEVWNEMFLRGAVTLDWRVCRCGAASQPGLDVRSAEALAFALRRGPYDLLFVDAGHLIDDVKRDHEAYGTLVRPGGVVAFHDALKRPTYEEEIQVWRYLETLPAAQVNVIGTEVGVAWLVKEERA